MASPTCAHCSVPHTCGMAVLLPLPGAHPHTAWHVLSETEERLEEQGEVRGGEVEKFSNSENYSKAEKWKAKIPHWETPWRISESEAEWFLWIPWNLTQICHLAVKPTRNVSLSINSFIDFRDFSSSKDHSVHLFLHKIGYSCIKPVCPGQTQAHLSKRSPLRFKHFQAQRIHHVPGEFLQRLIAPTINHVFLHISNISSLCL